MLILPKPVKDEFALGFIGRLCHINLVSSYFEMMRSLLVHYGLKSKAGAHLQALALLSGKSLQDFVSAHTIAPAAQTNWGVRAGRLGGKVRRSIGDERNPLKLTRQQAYLCPECIERQRLDLGFPFWHRAHQLPGIYWCPWHRSPLLGCDSLLIQRALPSIEVAQPERAPASAEDAENLTLQCFSDIMMGFLAYPERHRKTEFADRLRSKAVAIGLSVVEEPFGGRHLSDLACEKLPAWWLDAVIGMRGKSSGSHFKPIDGVLSAEPVGARTYALATALLFGPDEWQSLGIKRSS